MIFMFDWIHLDFCSCFVIFSNLICCLGFGMQKQSGIGGIGHGSVININFRVSCSSGSSSSLL